MQPQTAIYEKAGLSPRESEVLQLTLQDCSEEDISARLNIAPGTVKALKHRAKEKLRRIAQA